MASRTDLAERRRRRSESNEDDRPRSRSPHERRSTSEAQTKTRSRRGEKDVDSDRKDIIQGQTGKKQKLIEESSTENVAADFSLSGKLGADCNTFKGVAIKYSEPREARIPKTKWRLYEFKGDENTNTLYIHRQSAYLIGRDRKIVDFPTDHPSCSKQHAVFQYRLVDYMKDDGRKGKKVKPYLIDLESTNGTFINNQKIDSSRYIEVKEKDSIKFGFSTREYVLLHENSRDDSDSGE